MKVLATLLLVFSVMFALAVFIAEMVIRWS